MTLNTLPPSVFKKIFKTVLTLLFFIILILSFKKTEINFLKLIEKRQNAYSYIFGKKLTKEDHQEAMRQAQMYPQLMSQEEAKRLIREKYADQSLPNNKELQNEINQLSTQIYHQKNHNEWQAWIDSEYKSILDDKKGGYFPPETNLHKIKEYLWALVETIYIAIWGSLLAFLTATLVAFLAAQNTIKIIIPGDQLWVKYLRNSIYFLIRRLLDICRGFNEFVMALIFVAVIGLGPFAGVLALWIHTFGILGKVFSENLETCHPGTVEGVESCGANKFQILSFAIIPQVLPDFISYALLRFETNVRSATILGFCGAGGIGFLMFDKINGYLYREVATMMIIIIVTIGVLDSITSYIRRKYI
ncbi:MAG: phosphonate ABC transporter, permease protein PhnE [Bdellovibrionales bacterium RIFOXYB1_FULL_37_110]|nr:MAG: phosphonate ABC transporter, permease protein PhnE [Bdellovibrionales bacterium RIFOXYC1_FULL_37_79]OFZ57762.1 MAG: phosphonate ABC transporter, permease protein PhnE [Bdellovibrionales bacterium RIFOXYB1_FULL_37_110]OFZ62728.1 MAG: phosphonate ABC transporter, permease protein PhnE [Bdellovibrionales bacterium RIFOXYD1_FULL_36_51]